MPLERADSVGTRRRVGRPPQHEPERALDELLVAERGELEMRCQPVRDRTILGAESPSVMCLTSRVPLFALSTGHKVGLAVVGASLIVFALGSAILIPRFRPQFPGGGLRAFIVVTFVFFLGMLAAVEVFGAESKEGGEKKAETPTTASPPPTTAPPPSTTAKTTTAAKTTTTTAKPQTVQVTESEFKIVLAPSSLKAGPVTFKVTNSGAIPHDLAIVGGAKTSLIKPHGSATLTTTLKTGPIELYCSVPGHKAAGMDVKTKVS